MNALSLKIILSLILLFGLGTATGMVAARRLAPPPAAVAGAPARVPAEERWTKARYEEYRRRLDLTPEQAAAIAPHFKKFAQDMRQTREELRGRFAASARELNENIARDLTPQQRRELWKMVRERWQQRDGGPHQP